MRMLKLNNELGVTPDYEAFKFPGGELHFKLSNSFMQATAKETDITIKCRLVTSDDIILLILAVNTIKDKEPHINISVVIGYMAYQQADDKFSLGESFSLKYITAVLNSLPVQTFYVYDPHSLATGISLRNCRVIDNRDFISNSLLNIYMSQKNDKISFAEYTKNELCILSPDAGAYKKIFKLVENLKFNGQVETANKYRDQTDGSLKVRFSCSDFHGKDIVIIDDICVGGGTFIALAKELIKRNVRNLYLCISHGVFSTMAGASHTFIVDKLTEFFKGIYVTNSRTDKFDIDKLHMYKIL